MFSPRRQALGSREYTTSCTLDRDGQRVAKYEIAKIRAIYPLVFTIKRIESHKRLFSKPDVRSSSSTRVDKIRTFNSFIHFVHSYAFTYILGYVRYFYSSRYHSIFSILVLFDDLYNIKTNNYICVRSNPRV